MGRLIDALWETIKNDWQWWLAGGFSTLVSIILKSLIKQWWKDRKKLRKSFAKWWGSHINIFKMKNMIKFYERQNELLNTRLSTMIKIVTFDEIKKMFVDTGISTMELYELWHDKKDNIMPSVIYKGKHYDRPMIYELLVTSAITDGELRIEKPKKKRNRKMDTKLRCPDIFPHWPEVDDMLEERIKKEDKEINHLIISYDEYKDNLKQLKKSASKDPSLLE